MLRRANFDSLSLGKILRGRVCYKYPQPQVHEAKGPYSPLSFSRIVGFLVSWFTLKDEVFVLRPKMV
jgi:hypothetical protein